MNINGLAFVLLGMLIGSIITGKVFTNFIGKIISETIARLEEGGMFK